ncbi:hypothetical protein DACRYDRAFT_22463 [Dacryopinax primogenitus]|uniref:Uncharacterized protein n=1 Tax=Dacryopinax primogenitus (strain DJM 731) TaxID=1858805 RepID=M5FXN1_DACPD|nr:uncharacterized protein DACRYDRAFT_22463 [Dacryopinax primogenitus]EJU01239.1 hypothetical protein DACRYDRAFT_22463 [Dacryopinax primogenitus]
MLAFAFLALLIALLPSFPLTAALPIPQLADIVGIGGEVPSRLIGSTVEGVLDDSLSPSLKQTTRSEIVARLLAEAEGGTTPQASAAARALTPRASPNVQVTANAKRSTPELVLNTPAVECEKALSVIDFEVVCAPVTVLDPVSAAAFLQKGGLVEYKDGTRYTDPLYSASSGEEGSPLRTMITAYAQLRPKGIERRAWPFFTRWAMQREREGSMLLALSPNTAIRIADLKEIGIHLLNQDQFDHVKVAGVTFDWRTMQAIVDNITF